VSVKSVAFSILGSIKEVLINCPLYKLAVQHKLLNTSCLVCCAVAKLFCSYHSNCFKAFLTSELACVFYWRNSQALISVASLIESIYVKTFTVSAACKDVTYNWIIDRKKGMKVKNMKAKKLR